MSWRQVSHTPTGLIPASARTQRWVDLDFDCVSETFSTPEPDVYRKIYQRYDKTQDTNTFK